MSSSSGMASNPTRRVSCRSRSLSLVCKIPISLLSFLGTNTIGYQGIEGRFASDSYQAFLRTILAHTTAHLYLIHDGARYHTSQATTQFLAQQAERLTVHPLP